ncbi:MAG: 2-amino-4-hydroxy-6-hydroxymethyldihydropteridine diphosphokinase [Bacillus subtilis]|nr:2-amino-4-hydroxy-6-hydroxymethyldihydropteridine diphosphokinase [Bacillus subtilis]
MSIAYIGIGSNIGDRVGYVQQAHSLLNHTDGIKVLNSSSLYETEPYGLKDQEWFVNAVLETETDLKRPQTFRRMPENRKTAWQSMDA